MKKLVKLFHAKPFKMRTIMVYEIISFSLMYISVPLLAFGIQDYSWELFTILIFTLITLHSGYFASLIWNDINDKEIDIIAHPDRSLPSKRIGPKQFFFIALIFSSLVFIFSALISIWCLFIVGMAAIFVALHDKYFKKNIKFPAYSEIFTPLQWITVPIFGYVAIWSALPQSNQISFTIPLLGPIAFSLSSLVNLILLTLFTYFADNAHDLPEGIHDVDGDRKLGVQTYSTSFGIQVASKIAFFMFFISGIFGIFLYILTDLTLIFLIPFLLIWIYILNWSLKLIQANEQNKKELGLKVGQKGFDFLLMAYNLIFIDLILQFLLYTLN